MRANHVVLVDNGFILFLFTSIWQLEEWIDFGTLQVLFYFKKLTSFRLREWKKTNIHIYIWNKLIFNIRRINFSKKPEIKVKTCETSRPKSTWIYFVFLLVSFPCDIHNSYLVPWCLNNTISLTRHSKCNDSNILIYVHFGSICCRLWSVVSLTLKDTIDTIILFSPTSFRRHQSAELKLLFEIISFVMGKLKRKFQMFQIKLIMKSCQIDPFGNNSRKETPSMV